MPIAESLSSRAPRRAARIAGALCCLSPAIVAGQVVRGVVVDDASGRPLPGVVVVLFDSRGNRLTGVLAGDDGRYALRTTSPGQYAVRAERIGFRAEAPTKIALRAGETIELRLATRPVPVVLGAVRVTGRSPCIAGASDGREVSTVWDEARKALYATDLTQRQELFSARVSRFQRVLDARNGRVTSYETTEGRGVTRNPFVSAPAAQLSASGFVRQNASETVYFGPDAAVLLSDEFLRDHCFRLRTGEGARSELIGLGFEPVRGRDAPDIGGTLWIDRRTAELRDIEYTYRNVPNLPSSVKSEDFGGRIEFRRMSTGAWIVERWVIRMPVVVDAGPFGGPPAAPIPGAAPAPVERVRLAGVKEEGGEVLETIARGTRSSSAAERATVQGIVFDSTRMAPLGGARVFLDGTQFGARSGADGSFTIEGVPAGTYALSVVHPRFDSLDAPVPVETIALRDGESTSARLAGPSAETILARVCTEGERARGTAALRGHVRDAASGEPALDAQVLVTWRRAAGASSRAVQVSEQRAGTRTDSAGRYAVCGLPEYVRLTVRATAADRRSAPVELVLPERQLSVLDVLVGRSAAVVAAAPPPAVTTSGARSEPSNLAMREVARRRRRGGGSYLTRVQIERLRASRVTDLLRTLPGVSVRPDDRGVLMVELRGAPRLTVEPVPATRNDTTPTPPGQVPPTTMGMGTGRRCPAGFQVDGLPTDGGGSIDSDVRPEDIEVIEVYSGGQVPIEFAGRHSTCGLVLIWTRNFAERPEMSDRERDGRR